MVLYLLRNGKDLKVLKKDLKIDFPKVDHHLDIFWTCLDRKINTWRAMQEVQKRKNAKKYEIGEFKTRSKKS